MKKKTPTKTVEKIHSSIEDYRKSEVKREEGNNGNISQNTVGNSVKGFT